MTAAPATAAARRHTVVDSPYGPLTLVATDGVLSALYMTDQRHRPPEETFGVPDPEPFGETIQQLTEYFAGHRTTFDLPLNLAGTPFQRSVWAELLRIPYGETRTYGELAEEARKTGGLAGGRTGQRQEPRRDHRAVPPGDRSLREPHRLRRRPGPQAAAARLRERRERGRAAGAVLRAAGACRTRYAPAPLSR
ncbi:Methylated-DNA--protein-cysteine methyltransferase [Streptomyces griseus subsp. griseus]